MLITNGILITCEPENRILADHSIYIEGDRIQDLGRSIDLIAKYPQVERLDARGQYVMPGNICAHTHFYGAFAKGMAIPGPAPRDFPEILQKLWWPLDRALDELSIRFSVLPCLVDAIKYGTTTLFDHHASPNTIDGSLDIVSDAVDQSGLRAVLCYEVTDRDGPDKTTAGIKENVRYLKRLSTQPHPRLAAAFGLHAGLTLSNATLQACRDTVPGETGFHIHSAEHEADEYDSLQKSDLRVIDRLHKFGILRSNTITAHGVHFDAREIEILRDSGAWLSHQPRSNMNNAVGVAPIESMLRAGVKVCLGNDGFSNAMWEEWKTAYLLHKIHHRDPRRMNGNEIWQIAVHNNAALAGTYFPAAPLGRLTRGAFADLILVDYHPNTPLTPANLPWHILFGFQPGMVTTTMVAGKILMKDRQLLTLDEVEIAAKAREVAPQVWERYHQNVSRGMTT